MYTDILMAQKANVLSVLVLSGETKIEDLENYEQQPDIIIESIKELGELFLKIKTQTQK